MLVAEADDDRAGQRREVDHEARLEPLAAVREHVGQHQPPLGVGVDHLHGLPGMGFHHVARPLRRRRGHVLDQPDQPDRIDLRACRPASAAISPTTAAGAGHVPLHVLHAAGGLDADAAGVEGDALADEGERCAIAPAPALGPGRTRRATASPPPAARWRCPSPPRAARRSRAFPAPSVPSPRRSRPSRVSSWQRRAISAGLSTLAGSLTRSRASATPSATARAARPGGSGRVGIVGEHRQPRELRLVLRLLAGAVAVEAVARERGPQRRATACARSARRRRATRPRPAPSAAAALPAASSMRRRRERVGLPQPDRDDARKPAAGCEDGRGLALAPR